MFTVADCETLRREIRHVAAGMAAFRAEPDQGAFTADQCEAMANLTLAYRHIEDASMRLGKAIQALDGGVSVYDRNQVTGA